MPGKPCNVIINWNEETLGIFRQVYRVAADEKFRNHERGDINPSPEEIIEKFNVTTDDEWASFRFDLPRNKNVLMDRKFACYLIQHLIKQLRLPMRKPWYAKSFAQDWERKPVSLRRKDENND